MTSEYLTLLYHMHSSSWIVGLGKDYEKVYIIFDSLGESLFIEMNGLLRLLHDTNSSNMVEITDLLDKNGKCGVAGSCLNITDVIEL